MPAFTELDFDDFLAADYGRAVSAVGVVTGDRGLARQAVEDVLIGLVARPPARVIENRIAWVVAVASERVDELRRRERDGDLEGVESDPVAVHRDPTAPETGSIPLSPDTDPGHTIEVAMLRRLRDLPMRTRQVCVLSYLLGLSIERIAEGLGVADTVISRELQTARAELFPPREEAA
ncbi:sigma factor-like helix-turn-helix DNA-binding protein [Schumannella sp. 10F1B-5-1]|uniref:sigma factor-like helix-turn-helix DNA-binding protein n=1 Tax=Schumannella sp. 10F1B-5-1 TaxID=2590780 RepID=UPI0011302D92|nr:sigma factor-like helix-turn-helix DNA-binding protein [Schumannella sp. 10F1B-5-1]TPW71691.1 hypothetical protein FJ658_10115 [Schumannella sp. 10F1B-5-1]